MNTTFPHLDHLARAVTLTADEKILIEAHAHFGKALTLIESLPKDFPTNDGTAGELSEKLFNGPGGSDLDTTVGNLLGGKLVRHEPSNSAAAPARSTKARLPAPTVRVLRGTLKVNDAPVADKLDLSARTYDVSDKLSKADIARRAFDAGYQLAQSDDTNDERRWHERDAVDRLRNVLGADKDAWLKLSRGIQWHVTAKAAMLVARQNKCGEQSSMAYEGLIDPLSRIIQDVLDAAAEWISNPDSLGIDRKGEVDRGA